MGEFFPLHWLIILLVVVLLFGGRKIPEVMRGLGEGIRSFKDGMRGGDHPSQPSQTSSTANPSSTPAATPGEEKK
jgi:sec-independent protein translocase protein TatA